MLKLFVKLNISNSIGLLFLQIGFTVSHQKVNIDLVIALKEEDYLTK